MTNEWWYRYEDVAYASPLDEFDQPLGQSRIEVRLITIPVAARTPKGVWLGYFGKDRRFVLLKARKRFACPTKKEALESFLARKRRQRDIHTAWANRAQTAIAIAEKLVKEEQ